MTTIKALRNFGHLVKAVAAGTTLEVDPESFGGTYQDFLKSGVFEEVSSDGSIVHPAQVSVTGLQSSKSNDLRGPVVIKEAGGVVETIHPGSEVKVPE